MDWELGTINRYRYHYKMKESEINLVLLFCLIGNFVNKRKKNRFDKQ